MRLNGDGAERRSWAAGRGRFRAHLRHGPPHAPVPLSSFPADSKPSHPCPCLGRSLHPQGGKCTQHLKMLKEVPPGRSLRDRWRTVRGSRNLPRWAAQRHSSCPYPQTVSFGSSEKHVGVWGPLGHPAAQRALRGGLRPQRLPAKVLVPHGESSSCRCHCWNGPRVPSRLVYAGLAPTWGRRPGRRVRSLSRAGLGQC